ncbi:MAG: Na+/H+ antiporter subunit E, partial [Actinomycetota bacterium]
MTTTSSSAGSASASLPRSRHAILVAGLTFAWCALWGEVSVANILSGIAVSCGLVYLGVRNSTGMDGVTSGRVRLRPLASLAALVAWDLAKSTVEVAKEVLTPDDASINEAIIAVDLPPEAEHHLLLMVVAITVTPGTAVIDTDLERRKLYLHILHYDGRDAIEAHVSRLAELAFAAFPATSAPSTPSSSDVDDTPIDE